MKKSELKSIVQEAIKEVIKENGTAVANTILKQIKALDKMALMAWGAKNLMAGSSGFEINGKHYGPGLQMDVRGPKHKGRIIISLNHSTDTYDIFALTIRMGTQVSFKVKAHESDVYAEDLVRILDSIIG